MSKFQGGASMQPCNSLPRSCIHRLSTITYIGGLLIARPGRKQTTATKLEIYTPHSPRSSIHFLARCSNFCKPLKTSSEGCPCNQVSAAEVTSASDEK